MSTSSGSEFDNPKRIKNGGMMRSLLNHAMVSGKKLVVDSPTLAQYASAGPIKNTDYDPHTNVMDNLYSKRTMTIQVTPIENGYVVAIADGPGMLPRLIYAKDLNDVGQQITAFGVTQELEGKGANT